MTITPFLFEAFLKCPAKCWLRATGEVPSGNTYAEWVQTQNESYRDDGIKRLISQPSPGECVQSSRSSRREEAPSSADSLKTARWRLATDVLLRTDKLPQPRCSRRKEAPIGKSEIRNPKSEIEVSLVTSAATGHENVPQPVFAAEAHLHAIERIPSEGRGKPAQFVPIHFVFRNKLTKDDKLLLAFDALVLSQVLGREVTLGKIIHGDDHATLKVKTLALAGEVRKHLGKITALLSSPTPPDLVLNRHCAECEFQARCRKIAVEKDDLSLLGGMSEMERLRHRSKGIFTVTQLSYTFRPRRTSKRAKNPAKPRYLALQALAIRENTVYIHGTPTLPQSKTQVYLDIEGLPDRDFHYLIGALVVSDGHETFHSFWADTQADEWAIFAQFAGTISQLEDFRVFHFGDYDTAALKRMKPRLSESHQRQLDVILGTCTNTLSALYPHVYFPTYSNSLKDVCRIVGDGCSTQEVTGLHSIIWRTEWEALHELDLKSKLVNYNRTDCLALKKLTDFILSNMASATSSEESAPKVKHTDEIQKARPRWRMFARKDYALDDLRHITKCGYFDYQREKVFVKTHKHFRKISDGRRNEKRGIVRPNKIVDLVLKKCPGSWPRTSNRQPPAAGIRLTSDSQGLV